MSEKQLFISDALEKKTLCFNLIADIRFFVRPAAKELGKLIRTIVPVTTPFVFLKTS